MSELTRTELRRIADEFQSERDAAKRDAMRAFDERNVALDRLERAEALLRRWRRLDHGELIPVGLNQDTDAFLASPSAEGRTKSHNAERGG